LKRPLDKKGVSEVDRHLLQLKMSGWCVIDNVIPSAEVECIRESVLQTTETHRRAGPLASGVGFVPGVINHDQSFAPYLAEERLLGLVKAVLGAQVRISFTSAIINYPGNKRGGMHADWPYNQQRAGHIPAPYPDITMHLTTLWMLSPFSSETGGTLVVPGSHHLDNNPSGDLGIDEDQPFQTEIHATGEAGSVLVMDSRLWHASAPNQSDQARVALAVRYAPWWLDVKVLMPGSAERAILEKGTGKTDNEVPGLPREVFDRLPEAVQPLYGHWVI
jgi:hypothetical protein